MTILFCCDPFDRNTVDPDFYDEFAVAKAQGLDTLLFSFEDLAKEEDPQSATRKIKTTEVAQTIIYRGWMLKPEQYGWLYSVLAAKNHWLINSPIQYQNCHYLPDSYPYIKNITPKTVWVPLSDGLPDYDVIFNELKIFGDSPLILKDYVKSQKHYWDTACYIPYATDGEKVKSVTDKFLQLQGNDLNEGLVYREFVALEDLTTHSKSGMPLTLEYRLFFLQKQLIACYQYWDEGTYPDAEKPPLELFESVAQNVESNFFSMDIAKTKEGSWLVVETGDGQVAGLPDNADKNQFYQAMGNAGI